MHVTIIDLFPPTPRDPDRLHKLIWDEVVEEEFEFNDGRDRLLVSYQSGDEKVAYIEPVAIHEELPPLPLILSPTLHVQMPLESTYQTAWVSSPVSFRKTVETGESPGDSGENSR